MSKLYVFALMTAYCSGAYAPAIPRHEINTFLKTVIRENTNKRFDIFLALVDFHNLKPDENQNDFGGTTVFIAGAGEVGAEQNLPDEQGFLPYSHPVLLREQGNYKKGSKENHIRLRDQDSLLKQNERLQQILRDEAVRHRNETITGILILVICAGLFYRLKQKSNRLVNQKNKIITETNDSLDRLIKEKEWLLMEVHHRVRNNLHTILSLLESQSIFLENEAYRALEDSRSRVYAMSLIHRQLHQSGDINTIDMSVYLSEFVSHLQQSPEVPKIYFEINASPILLPLSQAMPLALIINEAVTNSIKHAFRGKRSGEIKISLSGKDELVKLVIADNGIGIDLSLLDTSLNSLGISLIRGLAEDIMGSLQFEVNNGTCIILSFDIGLFLHRLS